MMKVLLVMVFEKKAVGRGVVMHGDVLLFEYVSLILCFRFNSASQ